MLLPLRSTSSAAIRRAQPHDAAALGRVRVASWRATYANILPPAELARLDASASARRFRGAIAARSQSVSVVEQHSGPPFGYAWAGPQLNRDLSHRGEIYELYLQPEAQRQGSGRQLLTSMLWTLAERRLWPVVVWVLAANPARNFYRACGGRQILAGPVRVTGQRLVRLAFEWDEALPLP